MILNGTEGRMEITSKGLHSFGYDLNESRNVRIFNRQGEEIRKSPIDIGFMQKRQYFWVLSLYFLIYFLKLM